MQTSPCKPKSILAELGFGTLADAEELHVTQCEMVDLYEYCRRAGADEKFPADDRTFGADWIDLSKVKAQELAYNIANINSPEDYRRPREAVRNELEARDWNTALGIDQPTVQCRVRIHGTRWGLRFQSIGGLKGKELRNGALPEATMPGCDEGVEPPATPTVSPDDACAPAQHQGQEDPVLKEYLQ